MSVYKFADMANNVKHDEMNNIHLNYRGYTISIAQHKRANQRFPDIQEVAVLVPNGDTEIICNFDTTPEDLKLCIDMAMRHTDERIKHFPEEINAS